MKKIHVIGTVGLPANYGGWETLADNLVKTLSEIFEFTVYCDAKKYLHKPLMYQGCKLIYLPLNANGLQSIFYDFYSMLKSLRNSDLMLILGVSGCVFLPLIKFSYAGKIIVNIDGMEWRRDKWSRPVQMFLKLSEYFAVKFADVVVTDNKAIQNYVFENYGKQSELISYGADHAYTNLYQQYKQHIDLNSLNCFKVCRIEPENNIQMILDAFVSMQQHKLTIVGNWSNSNYGVTLKKNYSNFKNIKLLDPIYNIVELNKLRCFVDIYIHGHSAGGTNPSLVEAMYLKLPVFAFDVSYNRETTFQQCSYYKNTTELVILFDSLSMEKLNDNSIKMKLLADEHYTWKSVSDKYKKLFNT